MCRTVTSASEAPNFSVDQNRKNKIFIKSYLNLQCFLKMFKENILCNKNN